MDICLGANWSTHAYFNIVSVVSFIFSDECFQHSHKLWIIYWEGIIYTEKCPVKGYLHNYWIHIYSLKCTFLGIKSLKKMKRNWYCENIHAIKSLLDWPFCRITDLSIITSFRVCFFFPVTIFSNLKKKVSGITRKFAHTFFWLDSVLDSNLNGENSRNLPIVDLWSILWYR